MDEYAFDKIEMTDKVKPLWPGQRFGSGALSVSAESVEELAAALERYEPWKANTPENLKSACLIAAQSYADGDTTTPPTVQRDLALVAMQNKLNR